MEIYDCEKGLKPDQRGKLRIMIDQVALELESNNFDEGFEEKKFPDNFKELLAENIGHYLFQVQGYFENGFRKLHKTKKIEEVEGLKSQIIEVVNAHFNYDCQSSIRLINTFQGRIDSMSRPYLRKTG